MEIITIRVRGFAGRGWELEFTGPRKWVERMVAKYTRKINKIVSVSQHQRSW